MFLFIALKIWIFSLSILTAFFQRKYYILLIETDQGRMKSPLWEKSTQLNF
jgi:hypothetical protein